jgi:hypothetical protein
MAQFESHRNQFWAATGPKWRLGTFARVEASFANYLEHLEFEVR